MLNFIWLKRGAREGRASFSRKLGSINRCQRLQSFWVLVYVHSLWKGKRKMVKLGRVARVLLEWHSEAWAWKGLSSSETMVLSWAGEEERKVGKSLSQEMKPTLPPSTAPDGRGRTGKICQSRGDKTKGLQNRWLSPPLPSVRSWGNWRQKGNASGKRRGCLVSRFWAGGKIAINLLKLEPS